MARFLKYFVSIILIAFLATSCATLDQQQRISNLEKQVQELKKPTSKLTPQQIIALAEEAGAAKFWWRNCLTGTGCLDDIDDASLTDGDAAIVMMLSGSTTTMYPYVYDVSSIDSTDSPKTIEPQTGTGAWYLVRFYSNGLYSAADDGYHFMNFSNSGAETYPESDGDCYYRRDINVLYCEDSVYGWIPQQSSMEITSSANPLDLHETYCWGGIVYYTLASAGHIDLPPVQPGMEVVIIRLGGDYNLEIDPDGTEIINVNLDDESAGECIHLTNPGANGNGSWVRLRYRSSGKWMVVDDSNTGWDGCED